MIHFQGASVRLRGVTTNDTSLVVSWRNDSEISRYFFNESPVTPESHEHFIASLPPNNRLYIIERLSDNTPVGMIGLVNINQHSRSAEFGRFLIEPEATGNGYGKQALVLILEYAFGFLDLNRLWLEAFAENRNAICMYEFVGFISEGLLRQHIFKANHYHDVKVMGLLQSEYYERRANLSQELAISLTS